MASSSTIFFTELVYSDSVNSSTDLPVNNFVLPQLTDYFPNGNPLRSCTTASLVSYTPNPQPALLKRAPDAQPLAINTFPGVPELTPTISYTAEPNIVETTPSASSSDSGDGPATATEDGSVTNSPPTASSAAVPSSPAPPPSQQNTQTAPETPSSPSTVTQEASDSQSADPSATAADGSTQTSNTALGTITLAGSSTQMVGNSTSSQPSTWNYVCSAEGCTLASSSGATASSANASSTSTESVSQTTAQSSAARAVSAYSLGSLFLLLVILIAMA